MKAMSVWKEQISAADFTWSYYQHKLKGFLPRPRYEHCLRVAVTASRLARHYGLDEERARLAGLLHDVARDLSFEALLAATRRFELPLGPEEIANPLILHAPVGAALLESGWGIKDQTVLQAVALHTIAAPGMDDFCQLVYLADIIEPGRREWPGLQALRRLSYEHLGRAMLLSLRESFIYLQNNNDFIHPRAVAANDFLTLQLMEQETAKE
jgi:predicted HD superfamily hydrolase involved in NAD metabolism